MQPIQAYSFYELATSLRNLFDVRNHTGIANLFAPLTEAQAKLDALIKGDPISLDVSQAPARKLLDGLAVLFNRYFIDPDTKQLTPPSGEQKLDASELSHIAELVEKFEKALAAELSLIPHYRVEKYGIYSTKDLVENAHHIYATDLRDSMPESVKLETQKAGRALAFGFGTAAVMHALRAVEGMLKNYYEVFFPAPTQKNERAYGIYLKKLLALSDETGEGKHPDKRILQSLAQIREHYRNPLVTPERDFSCDEAATLFSMATAQINLIAEHIKKL